MSVVQEDISNRVYQQEGPNHTTSRGEVMPHQLLFNQWIGREGPVEMHPSLSSLAYGFLLQWGGRGGEW